MLSEFPFLATEAEQANARRLIMFRSLSAYPGLLDRLNRPDGRVNWLPDLVEAQPPERALWTVPFFWYHLRQAFTALAAGAPAAMVDDALDGVALAALDSFAAENRGFPAGKFPLPPVRGAQMMRLGVSFSEGLCPDSAAVACGRLTLWVDGGMLRVSTSGAPHCGIRQLSVRRMESASVDLGSSAERLEHDEDAIAKLIGDLTRSAEWIASASPCCASLIAEEIQFLVPLRRGPSSHYSFTLSHIPGLLFVGGCDQLLTIVEALIHETGHARLHHANEVHPLVPDEQPQTLYSPWRMDPRPASGVLHGLYVFALVLVFWIDVIESRMALSGSQENYVRSRIALTALQVREAASVLDQVHLLPFGLQVLARVRDAFPGLTALPVSQAELAAAGERCAVKRARAASDFPNMVMPQP
jgi:HEXXH motif-containing protein